MFGGSRFMWMIGMDETDFIITFIDRYRTMDSHQLKVKHTVTLEWPDKLTVQHMPYDELKLFVKRCADHGYTQFEISQHYSEKDRWIINLLNSRKAGRPPRDVYVSSGMCLKCVRQAGAAQVSRWSPSKIKLFRVYHFLKEFKLPAIPGVLQPLLGCDFVQSDYKSAVHASYNVSSAVEQHITQTTIIDLQDVLIEYADRICEKLLLISANDASVDDNLTVTRLLCRFAGVQRSQKWAKGRYHRFCSEQDIKKIKKYVDFLQDVKTNIRIAAANADQLQHLHLLKTTKQNFNQSAFNQERNNKWLNSQKTE